MTPLQQTLLVLAAVAAVLYPLMVTRRDLDSRDGCVPPRPKNFHAQPFDA